MKYLPNVVKRSSYINSLPKTYDPENNFTYKTYYQMFCKQLVPYALTVKYLKKSPVFYKADYDPILNDITSISNGNIDPIRYEMDSNDVLHLHGILWASPHLRYTSLSQKGFHIYLQRIYSLELWQVYIDKDATTELLQDRVIIKHYYRHNYGFDRSIKM